MDALSPNLADAWKEEQATALGVSVPLSRECGKPLPSLTLPQAHAATVRLREKRSLGPVPLRFHRARVARFDPPGVKRATLARSTGPTAGTHGEMRPYRWNPAACSGKESNED